MKTELLIEMLARGAHQEKRTSPWRVLFLGIGGGIFLSMTMMIITLRVNSEFLALLTNPNFLTKIAYVSTYVLIAFTSLIAVSMPGAKVKLHFRRLALPFVAISCIALLAFVDAEPALRADLIFGQTWSVCAVLIALLSMPVFTLTLMGMKELAPTNLTLAGAVCGLFSGAAGALVYCVHCPEVEVPFVAIWYTLGMMIPMVIGYFLGPKVLRW